jgi:hypothetical protein
VFAVRARARKGSFPYYGSYGWRFNYNVKEQLQSPHRIEIHARGLPTTFRDSKLNLSSHAPVSSEVIRLTDRRAVRTSASGGAAAVDARAHASPADARDATITSGSRE